ncbi:hypothetical protein PM082_004920 [Marasmius tenuissimus]|nr:hypothetical protein PM082_004920 [Marasmius tenuissimus]
MSSSDSSSSSELDSTTSPSTIATSITFTSVMSTSTSSSNTSTSHIFTPLPPQAPPATVISTTVGFQNTYVLPASPSSRIDAGTPISVSASSPSELSTPNRLWLPTSAPTRTSESTPRMPSQSPTLARPLTQLAVSSTALAEGDVDNVSESILVTTQNDVDDHSVEVSTPASEFSVSLNWAALASHGPENHNAIPHTVVHVTDSVRSAGRFSSQGTPSSFPNSEGGSGDEARHGPDSSVVISGVCGGVAFLAIILLLCFSFFRRRRRRGLSIPDEGPNKGWSYVTEVEKQSVPVHDHNPHHSRVLRPHTTSPTSNPNPFASPYDPSRSRRNTSSSISSSINFARSSTSDTETLAGPEALVTSSFEYNLSYHPRNAIRQPSLMTIVDMIRGQWRVGDLSADEAGWNLAQARTGS